MSFALLAFFLMPPQDSVLRGLVVEVMPVLVEKTVSAAAGQGANPDAGLDVYLMSFVALGSAAAGEDLDSASVARALGRVTGRRTPSSIFRCRHERDGRGRKCVVNSSLYLELVGLLVSPLHVEATLVALWPVATASGESRVGSITIRLRLRREGGRWVMQDRAILSQT
jgi:hypothetical protein